MAMTLQADLFFSLRSPNSYLAVGRYIFRDAARVAEWLEIPHRWPRPDPVVQNLVTREIAANQAALEAAGHWGGPTLVFEGEPFFGQDRIDLARFRMGQKGVRLGDV